MSDGFLGRWSKRKLAVKEGKPVEAEPPVTAPAPPRVAEGAASLPSDPAAVQTQEPVPLAPSAPAQREAGAAPEPPPVLTLDDVKALTAESDFSRFAAPHVAPEVKNAALKKLFSDPHYNIMDGLDVYIDDYTKPDPMPESMIRQLAGVKFLRLFEREEKEEAEAQAARNARDDANNPTPQSVAQSEAVPPAVAESSDHADPDLRLQQDHAAPGEDPGRGAG